jgi:hypothetical protein
MLTKNYLIAICLLLLSCTSEPIHNIIDAPITPNSKADDKQISEVIRLAGRRQGWDIQKIKPGELMGIYKIRGHTALVAIPYTRNKFSIIYENSINLDYDNNEIHRNYNVWVKRLAEQIQNDITFRLP